jgi:hypothetical protein
MTTKRKENEGNKVVKSANLILEYYERIEALL